MKLIQTLSLELQPRLQMLQLQPEKTAFILGYIKGGVNDTVYPGFFEIHIQTLREMGIANFVFPFWYNFEKIFLQAAINTWNSRDRYVLISEIDQQLPTRNFFDDELYGEDFIIPPNKDFYETVLTKCRTVLSFNVENVVPHEEILRMAQRKKKRLVNIG